MLHGTGMDALVLEDCVLLKEGQRHRRTTNHGGRNMSSTEADTEILRAFYARWLNGHPAASDRPPRPRNRTSRRGRTRATTSTNSRPASWRPGSRSCGRPPATPRRAKWPRPWAGSLSRSATSPTTATTCRRRCTCSSSRRRLGTPRRGSRRPSPRRRSPTPREVGLDGARREDERHVAVEGGRATGTTARATPAGIARATSVAPRAWSAARRCTRRRAWCWRARSDRRHRAGGDQLDGADVAAVAAGAGQHGAVRGQHVADRVDRRDRDDRRVAGAQRGGAEPARRPRVRARAACRRSRPCRRRPSRARPPAPPAAARRAAGRGVGRAPASPTIRS